MSSRTTRRPKTSLEQALKIKDQHYGQDNYEVATTSTSLGAAYTNLEDYDKAKDIIERAVNIKVMH